MNNKVCYLTLYVKTLSIKQKTSKNFKISVAIQIKYGIWGLISDTVSQS